MDTVVQERYGELVQFWRNYAFNDYQDMLTSIGTAWNSYQKTADSPFIKLANGQYRRDEKDPRWQVFHAQDLDYFDRHQATLFDKKSVKLYRNLLMWMNTQYLEYKGKRYLSDEQVPEPGIPRPFQGDLRRAEIIYLVLNSGENLRLSELTVNQQAQTFETRERIFRNIKKEYTEKKEFAAIEAEERYGGNGWYHKYYAGPRSLFTDERYQGKFSMKQDLAEISLFAYTTGGGKNIPLELHAALQALPSAQVLIQYVQAYVAALATQQIEKCFVIRELDGWQQIFDQTALKDFFVHHAFVGLNGQMHLSVANLYTLAEKADYLSLREQLKKEEGVRTSKGLNNHEKLVAFKTHHLAECAFTASLDGLLYGRKKCLQKQLN